jgi:hypothetical protein
MFGILLCSLVVLFSTSAKLATYQHASAAKQIASMKLMSKSVAPDVQAAPQVSSLIWLVVFAIFVYALATTFLSFRNETEPFANSWFSAWLAVRPPPTI